MQRLFRRVLVALVVLVVLVGTLASCTPEQAAWCRADTVRCRQAWDAMEAHRTWADQQNRQSRDCFEAIDRHWPASSREKFKGIVWRESRNNPAARNPTSSARGCAQLMQSLHAHRYGQVGCYASQWSNPDCNIRAALTLYRDAGWSPWALTV